MGVFMIRETRKALCLRYEGDAGNSLTGSGTARLTKCSTKNDHRLFWHPANAAPWRDDAHQCCSGLRAWNTDQCLLDLGPKGKHFRTVVCDISGSDKRQYWSLSNRSGKLKHESTCIVVSDKRLSARKCTAMADASADSETTWASTGAFE